MPVENISWSNFDERMLPTWHRGLTRNLLINSRARIQLPSRAAPVDLQSDELRSRSASVAQVSSPAWNYVYVGQMFNICKMRSVLKQFLSPQGIATICHISSADNNGSDLNMRICKLLKATALIRTRGYESYQTNGPNQNTRIRKLLKRRPWSERADTNYPK